MTSDVDAELPSGPTTHKIMELARRFHEGQQAMWGEEPEELSDADLLDKFEKEQLWYRCTTDGNGDFSIDYLKGNEQWALTDDEFGVLKEMRAANPSTEDALWARIYPIT